MQACGPSVTLSVEPSHVCRGETVTIKWTAPAPGRVSFTADRSANVSFDMTSGLPSEGSMSATVEDDAIITATASLPDEGRIANSVPVKVIFRGQIESIDAVGECLGATPTWSAYVPPSEWSDRIRVGVVTNPTTRSITVTHDGVPAGIPADGSTDRLSGTGYAGAWSIENNLASPGTNPCSSPERGGPPLDPITIDVELSCE